MRREKMIDNNHDFNQYLLLILKNINLIEIPSLNQ